MPILAEPKNTSNTPIANANGISVVWNVDTAVEAPDTPYIYHLDFLTLKNINNAIIAMPNGISVVWNIDIGAVADSAVQFDACDADEHTLVLGLFTLYQNEPEPTDKAP